MKTLSQIKREREESMNELFKDCGVFWAFSNEQFNENKTPLKEGEKYTSMGAGGYLPKINVDRLLKGSEEIEKIFKAEISERKSLRRDHIVYELGNHESYYTGSIEDALEALGDDYTKAEVAKVYHEERVKFYANEEIQPIN